MLISDDERAFYTYVEHSQGQSYVKFPKQELAQGASLRRMMTLGVREILNTFNFNEEEAAEIKTMGTNTIPKLRYKVENYLESETQYG